MEGLKNPQDRYGVSLRYIIRIDNDTIWNILGC